MTDDLFSLMILVENERRKAAEKIMHSDRGGANYHLQNILFELADYYEFEKTDDDEVEQ